MNEHRGHMDDRQQELFEKQLRSLASGMEYPRTPDLAHSVTARLHSASRPGLISRRWVWSLMALLILFASLMLIPPARAAILDFIQIGVVRIFRGKPAPPNQQVPLTQVPVTATVAPTPRALIPVLESLAGETTLADAQKAVNYPIRLPAYPPDLGQPDRVFVQNANGKMLILVWLNPQQPDQIRMSLHSIPEGSWAVEKMEPSDIQETRVNGQHAVWVTGPYPLRLQSGDFTYMRLMQQGHALIWEQDTLTYRLETDLPLDEAIRIAESLKPIQ